MQPPSPVTDMLILHGCSSFVDVCQLPCFYDHDLAAALQKPAQVRLVACKSAILIGWNNSVASTPK